MVGRFAAVDQPPASRLELKTANHGGVCGNTSPVPWRPARPTQHRLRRPLACRTVSDVRSGRPVVVVADVLLDAQGGPHLIVSRVVPEARSLELLQQVPLRGITGETQQKSR